MNNNKVSISRGFFAYIYKLDDKDVRRFNYNIEPMFHINKRNYNTPWSINPDNILKRSNIDLYKYSPSAIVSNEYQIPVMDIDIEIENFKSKISNHIKGMKKGFEKAIKCNAIKKINIFTPFIRKSNLNNSLIFTHFILIQYFNDTREFVVLEEIPDCSIYTHTLPAAVKYSKQSLISVRSSMFAKGKYQYGVKTHQSDLKEVYVNYILLNFIYCNFNIKINKMKRKLIITSNDSLDLYINKKSRSKHKYGEEESFFRVGISRKIENYDKYCTMAFEHTSFYIPFIYLTDYFKDSRFDRINGNDIRSDRFIQVACKAYEKLINYAELSVDSEINFLLERNKGIHRWEFYNKATKPGWEALLEKLSNQ